MSGRFGYQGTGRGEEAVERCKCAKVERWNKKGNRGLVDEGTGGQGKRRQSAKVQIATGSLCKGAKVKREGGQWKRGRGDKRYSAKVQMCKGANVEARGSRCKRQCKGGEAGVG